jgi:hypothetical protein
MSTRLLLKLVTVYLLLVLQACAMAPRGPSSLEVATTIAIPLAEPALDHYIAWVPRDEAQTATVARALTHTALGSARKQAGDSLCDGTWIGNNSVTNVIGPLQAWAPTADGGYPAWYYRISHKPGLKGCTASTNAQVYQVMASNLPEWLRVQTAYANTAQQGQLQTVTLLEATP